MNHGICFFRSLQWGIFYVVSFFLCSVGVVVVDSLVTFWAHQITNEKIKLFRVKTAKMDKWFSSSNWKCFTNFCCYSWKKLNCCFRCVKCEFLAIYHLHIIHSLYANHITHPQIYYTLTLNKFEHEKKTLWMMTSDDFSQLYVTWNNDALTRSNQKKLKQTITFKFASIVSREKTKI